MREGLRKITELPFRTRIVFLGVKAKIVAQFQEAFEEIARFVTRETPLASEIIGSG